MNDARSGDPTGSPPSPPRSPGDDSDAVGEGSSGAAARQEAAAVKGAAGGAHVAPIVGRLRESPRLRTDAAVTETDPIAVTAVRDALRQLSRGRAPQAHVMLIIYHRQGAETVRLAEGIGVVIGRDPTADVAIPERSLSRRHARFTLLRGDVVVEDLQSTNGTFISGERIERGVLKLDDEVMLGEITASLRVLASSEIPVLNLEALDALRGAVDRSARAEDAVGGRTPVGGTPAPADEGLVVRSDAMRPIIESAMRLARSSAPVLLQGETGTGKDVLAKLIHEAGPRRHKQMIRVGCSGVPAPLIESTLFGHEPGAFPGANQAQEGVLESAAGGTVLLDEVGDLPLSAQAALLRVLDTKRVVRLGSTREIDIDARIVATTHRDLEAMCDAGVFRSDLLYRLNTVALRVPPLCERRDDIAPLATRFLQQASESHRRNVRSIDPEAVALLEAYPWPGNVRELRNAIERAVMITRGDVVTLADLPEGLHGAMSRRNSTPPPDRAPGEAASPSSVPPAPAPAIGLKAQMDRLEAEIILEALRATNGNLAMASRRLRMPLRTLQEKLTSHGLKRSDYREDAADGAGGVPSSGVGRPPRSK